MSHSTTYIVFKPGHCFNRLIDPAFRASADQLAELVETGSLWDGRLPVSPVEFSVELSGLVTVLWLPVKYSIFYMDAAEQKRVLEFESKLVSSVGAARVFRLDELLLERWELLSGEDWFRSKCSVEDLSKWIVSQDTSIWLELNNSSNENEYQGNDEADRPGLETDQEEEISFAHRLLEDPISAARAVAEWIDQPDVLEKMLIGIADGISSRPSNIAEPLATAVLALPVPRRDSCLLRLAEHPDESIRAAAFRVLTPMRFAYPGEFRKLVASASELLSIGSMDSSPEVRQCIAGCAFGLGQAQPVEGHLLEELKHTTNIGYRILCILALGGANGELSRNYLTDLIETGPPREGAAAVRALAARSDGHAALLSSLEGKCEEVRAAALFALSNIVIDLKERDLQHLMNRSSSSELQSAVESYLGRTEKRM
jgi:HEAT repeat protein